MSHSQDELLVAVLAGPARRRTPRHWGSPPLEIEQRLVVATGHRELLNPESTQSSAKRAKRSLARFAMLMPPTLSDVLAAKTDTAMSSSTVSTMPKVLRPLIFFPASKSFFLSLTV